MIYLEINKPKCEKYRIAVRARVFRIYKVDVNCEIARSFITRRVIVGIPRVYRVMHSRLIKISL